MNWFRHLLPTGHDSEAKESGMAWPKSQNGEIVETWSNPINLCVSDDWHQLRRDLCASAKKRKKQGNLPDWSVRDLEYIQVPNLQEGIAIAACIEVGEDEGLIKHAIIRWPGRTNLSSEAG